MDGRPPALLSVMRSSGAHTADWDADVSVTIA